jgi:hypothetical protein
VTVNTVRFIEAHRTHQDMAVVFAGAPQACI